VVSRLILILLIHVTDNVMSQKKPLSYLSGPDILPSKVINHPCLLLLPHINNTYFNQKCTKPKKIWWPLVKEELYNYGADWH